MANHYITIFTFILVIALVFKDKDRILGNNQSIVIIIENSLQITDMVPDP
jgi:hypothetical protein